MLGGGGALGVGLVGDFCFSDCMVGFDVIWNYCRSPLGGGVLMDNVRVRRIHAIYHDLAVDIDPLYLQVIVTFRVHGHHFLPGMIVHTYTTRGYSTNFPKYVWYVLIGLGFSIE